MYQFEFLDVTSVSNSSVGDKQFSVADPGSGAFFDPVYGMGKNQDLDLG